MCDTFAALPGVTDNGITLLAKNSDREPNEAQNITFVPAREHPSGGEVHCTYISIPQVEKTNAALLSRPFWMYGAEMGVNEHSVAIGNEAVFTKKKYRKTGLTGMDLIRLALERTSSAYQALEVIISLIEEHGQGGNCAMEGKLYYHNSFIIADPSEAYILETADFSWAWEKIESTGSISNCLTLNSYDEASKDLKNAAFQKRMTDPLVTFFARGKERQGRSSERLNTLGRGISAANMMSILRDHGSGTPYRPGSKPMENICMHAGGLISSQSTGSMVALLKKDRPPLVYLTGTAAPCVSFYKPHTILRGQTVYCENAYSDRTESGEIELYGNASSRYDPSKHWWRGEDVHRRVLMNYATLIPEVNEYRDGKERRAMEIVTNAWLNNDENIYDLCCENTWKLLQYEEKLCELIRRRHRGLSRRDIPWWLKRQYKRWNKKAGISLK